MCRTTDEIKQNLLFAAKLYFGKQFENNPKTTGMNKLIVTVALLFIALGNAMAQSTDFEYEKEQIKNVKATVKVLNNGELYVIVPDNNENMRYISQQLPKEFKVDGLKVTFTGWEGKIPPNVRMMGKPLKLKCICISKSEMKKHGLKKAKYTFK